MTVHDSAASPRDWRYLKSIDLLGRFALVAVAVVVAADLAYAWSSWNTVGVVEDALAGVPEEHLEQIDAADQLSLTFGWLFIVSSVIAGVVFVAWLWRARVNSEQIQPLPHARSRGWVIGGWIVPIVSFWFPYQVVRDVWKASEPATIEPRRSAVLGWWWFWFLAASISATVSWRLYKADPGTSDEAILQWVRNIAVADTVSAVSSVVAAGCVAVIVRRISGWQHALRDQPHEIDSALAG